MPNLTEAQRIILTEIEAQRSEAIRFQGKWWFRDDVRRNAELAERVVKANLAQSCVFWLATRQCTMRYKWLMSITR